jgi:hypothetical protein
MDKIFKLWDDTQKKMHEVSTIEEIIDGCIPYGLMYTHVSQFTGLHDKNNTPIYENDLLQFDDDADLPYEYEGNQIVKVEWSIELCGFLPFCDHDSDCGVYVKTEECLIVGNIFETPELYKNIKT